MSTTLKDLLEKEFILFFDDKSPNSVSASPSASSTPLPRRGVSLAWLRSLAAILADEDMLHEDSSTRYVVSKVLLPYVKKQWGSNGHLWSALPASQIGPPSFYVIHSWGGNFFDLVSQLCEQLAPKDLKHKGQPWIDAHATSSPCSYSSTFVWLDFLSVSHQCCNVPTLSPGEASQFDIELMRSAILSCPEGAVFVIDPNMHVLSRSWCLMEAFQAVYMLEPGKLQVAFPWEDSTHDSTHELMPFDFPSKFIAAVYNIDILHSETYRADDKAKIVFQAKQGLGVKRTQDILIAGLVRASRATLRWGNLSHFFYYCNLLIQSGELSLLFTRLFHIPEIQEEDSSSLDEIREIFQTFDEARTGRLLEEAFVRVLGCAGFTIREAVEVYDAISGQDGREGVGIDEFTGWWAGSQKEKVEAGVSTPKISGDGLCKMIEGLCVFLERKKLIPHATHLRCEVARIKGLPDSPICPKMPPPTFNGDWKKFISKLSWMLHNDNVKAASKHIYEFLVDNADSIHCKIQQLPLPPSFAPNISRSSSKNIIGASAASFTAGSTPSSSGSLSRHNSAGWGRRIVKGSKMQRLKDLQLTMKSYLEILVRILRWHPDHGSLMNHLSRTAQEFFDMAARTSRSVDARLDDEDSEEDSDEDEDEDGGQSSRRSKSGRLRGKSTPRNPGGEDKAKKGGKSYKDWYNFNLISDMVHLKYGDGEVSQDRIKEAGNALSQWMAGRRGVGNTSHGGGRDSDISISRKSGAAGQSRAAVSSLKDSYIAGRATSEFSLPSLSDPTGGEEGANDRWNNLKSMPSLSSTPRSTKSQTGRSAGGLTPRQIVMGGGRGEGVDRSPARPLVPELPLGTSLAIGPESPRARTQGFSEDIEPLESSRGLSMQSPRSMTHGSRLTMSRLVLPITPRSGGSMFASDREESPRSSKKPLVPPLQLSGLKSNKTSLPSIQSHQGSSSATDGGPNSSRSVGFGEIYSQDEETPQAIVPDPPLSSRLPATRTKSSLSTPSTGFGFGKIKAKVSISGLDLNGSQSQGGSPRDKSSGGEPDVTKRKRLLAQLSTIMQLSQLSHGTQEGE